MARAVHERCPAGARPDADRLGRRGKIAHPPRPQETGGSPGSDPEDGDLVHFVPRGHLRFSHDATGVGSSDATLHLGT